MRRRLASSTDDRRENQSTRHAAPRPPAAAHARQAGREEERLQSGLGAKPRTGRPDSLQMLINQLFEALQYVHARGVVERQDLQEKHGTDAVLRIDPEMGVVDPAPTIATRPPFVDRA